MEVLKLDNRNTTLVDSVEESLIRFFKEKGLRPGSSIPNEIELAASLGVGRPVLREALSRFKMTGMIVSRTKKGMILGEPSLLGGMKRCINPLLMNRRCGTFWNSASRSKSASATTFSAISPRRTSKSWNRSSR